MSADGLTYTFILRAGATFQDGSPITANDVEFSLSRAVNPDTVEGDTSLDLHFKAAEMNDVLKSLTVLDLGEGHIASISYESTLPTELNERTYA